MSSRIWYRSIETNLACIGAGVCVPNFVCVLRTLGNLRLSNPPNHLWILLWTHELIRGSDLYNSQVTFQRALKCEFCCNFHKKVAVASRVCRTALFRSALENPDPGASNGGSNVEIRHFGAFIAASEVAGRPGISNLSPQIARQRFAILGQLATWKAFIFAPECRKLKFDSLLDAPRLGLSSALWISVVRQQFFCDNYSKTRTWMPFGKIQLRVLRAFWFFDYTFSNLELRSGRICTSAIINNRNFGSYFLRRTLINQAKVCFQ